MPQVTINWIAFVVAGFAALAYGFIAVGPLTTKIWMPLITKAKIKPFNFKDRPDIIVVLVAGPFVSTFVLCLSIALIGITTWWLGLIAGAIAWIGFGAMTSLQSAATASWPYSLWLYGFLTQLLLYAGQGIMFAVWR